MFEEELNELIDRMVEFVFEDQCIIVNFKEVLISEIKDII